MDLAGSSSHSKGLHVHRSEEKKTANHRLKDLSPFRNASLMEVSQFASTSVLGKICNIFGFEPLQDLYLGTSKLRKECSFKFLGSDSVMMKPAGGVEQKNSKPNWVFHCR